MGRDASLSDFTSEPSTESSAEAEANDADAAGVDGGLTTEGAPDPDASTLAGDDDEEPDVVDPASVSPAVVTAQVGTGVLSCPSCDREVRRLWAADGGPVCTSCKTW